MPFLDIFNRMPKKKLLQKLRTLRFGIDCNLFLSKYLDFQPTISLFFIKLLYMIF